MLKQKTILLISLLFYLFSACEQETVKITRDLEGTWVINEITHFADEEMTIVDTVLTEPVGEISFEFCNFRRDGNCDGSVTYADGEEYIINYYVADFTESDIFGINVGIDLDSFQNNIISFLDRPLAVTGSWIIEEHTEDKLTFTFERNIYEVITARVKCTRK